MHTDLINSIDLSGRTACITGAGGGIGRATAEKLAQAGATLLLMDIYRARLNETAAAVERLESVAVPALADISNVAEIERSVSEFIETHDKIDILVNNASILLPQRIDDVDEHSWDQTVDINLKGYFFLSKTISRYMIRSGKGGSIINVASQSYLVPRSGMSSYATTKGGVIAMTRAFAKELGVHNIRVNAVSPGEVDTLGSVEIRSKMRAMAEKHGGPNNQVASARSVFNRQASAEEIANAILFLACDLSLYVTAAILPVDGGYSVM